MRRSFSALTRIIHTRRAMTTVPVIPMPSTDFRTVCSREIPAEICAFVHTNSGTVNPVVFFNEIITQNYSTKVLDIFLQNFRVSLKHEHALTALHSVIKKEHFHKALLLISYFPELDPNLELHDQIEFKLRENPGPRLI
jgi:hypothetical protein